jgi:transposase-like protein
MVLGVAELRYDLAIERKIQKIMKVEQESIQCPECKSIHVNKNGRKRGKQNHICIDCGRQFIDCYEAQQGYSEEVKRECLTMYVNGMGFRGIERIKGVHHTSYQYYQLG